jgi:hypothetical protein
MMNYSQTYENIRRGKKVIVANSAWQHGAKVCLERWENWW